MKLDPLLLLAEDKELITYRKNLNKITKSVTSTILLQQILYWSKKKNHQPFFKFRAHCSHELYKDGDSWTEELGFGLSEFDTALKRIGTKITKGKSKDEAFDGTEASNLVIYWTDSNRITWYHLNANLLRKMVNSIYLEESEIQDTYEDEKSDLPLTETTQETTTEKLDFAKNAKSEDDFSDLFDEPIKANPPKTPAEAKKRIAQAMATWQHNQDGLSPPEKCATDALIDSGWQIRPQAIRQTLICFMAYTSFKTPPNNDTNRKSWYKALKAHSEEYPPEALPDLYKRADERLFNGDNQPDWKPPTGPWSYTKTMAGIIAEDRQKGRPLHLPDIHSDDIPIGEELAEKYF